MNESGKEKRKVKPGRIILWVLYLALVGCLVFLSVTFLRDVHSTVLEYDASLPEKTAQAALDELLQNARAGTSPDYVTYPLLGSDKYDTEANRSPEEAFLSKVLEAKELTFRLSGNGDGENLGKTYLVLADGEKLATLSLTGQNPRTRLVFFSMADWTVEKLVPVVSASYYSVRIYLPENLRGFLNGVEISEEEIVPDEDGIPCADISGLLQEPSVRIEDEDGNEIPYLIRDGVFSPVRYRYDFSLPPILTVTLNGNTLTGEPDGESLRYSVREMLKPEIRIYDPSGYSVLYEEGSEIPLYDYSIRLPENFTLRIRDFEPAVVPGSFMPHKDQEAMASYLSKDLPGTVLYTFSLTQPRATLSVTDNLGKTRSYSPKTRTLTILEQSKSSEMPDMPGNPDPLAMAEKWSNFMSVDLSGDLNGFYEVATVLIRDTYYYNYAYRWATGYDIAYTWVHRHDGFTEESVTDYFKVDDTCFSCRVSFVKNMTLYVGHMKRSDIFDSIVYFVYIDDTPNNGVYDPHWAIALMYDCVEEGS